MKEWVSGGGSLISVQSASRWVVKNGLIKEELVENEKLSYDIPYDQVRLVSGAQRIGGAIFNVEMDNTHPIAYGYNDTHPVFRRGTTFFKLSEASAANVARYTSSPLISGYIAEEKLSNSRIPLQLLLKNKGADE